MALYLLQVAYTPEAWAAIIANPEDRVAVVSKAVEKLGGKVESGWLSFGDYDTIVIMQMPDNVGAAAFAIAVAAGGACKAVKTTPLLSREESAAALKKATASGYKPPKGKGK